ncbi:DUF1156 domain-containing protein [Intrasporangium sp.]|uniref:DUF1156 domain-containing protein n=1 Tax=Intrasporangium sp. TaxID=1925024 RepID=UPI00322208BF
MALPLEAINRESARENYIYRGNPSSVHKWWAQRPLAAARAVLFAQLVDDPSSRPAEFPTQEAQDAERKRLFELIERLVVWENAGDERLLAQAHAEILRSTDGNPPPILDPFAGGGSIPLEAQRLGLEAHASDLNPVAVLINKALIEIPPRYAAQPPVFPGAASDVAGIAGWPRASGLAEDVRRYGQWMRDEAQERIGHLYPKAEVAGKPANVIAWIWARTVTCPNPACGIAMPLVRSFWLSKKKDRKTWAVPVVGNGQVTFDIETGASGPVIEGTVGRTGAACISCHTPVPLSYVREQSRVHGLGAQLMSVVAEGARQRLYLPADHTQSAAANIDRPEDVPEGELFDWPGRINVYRYGMTHFWQLFTNRQLVALTTFSDLVGEARDRVAADAKEAGHTPEHAEAYANSVTLYLACILSKVADYNNSCAVWYPAEDRPKNLFARQAIPMVWDFPEVNPLGAIGGTWSGCNAT